MFLPPLSPTIPCICTFSPSLSTILFSTPYFLVPVLVGNFGHFRSDYSLIKLTKTSIVLLEMLFIALNQRTTISTPYFSKILYRRYSYTTPNLLRWGYDLYFSCFFHTGDRSVEWEGFVYILRDLILVTLYAYIVLWGEVPGGPINTARTQHYMQLFSSICKHRATGWMFILAFSLLRIWVKSSNGIVTERGADVILLVWRHYLI